jgi:hypothetical protein
MKEYETLQMIFKEWHLKKRLINFERIEQYSEIRPCPNFLPLNLSTKRFNNKKVIPQFELPCLASKVMLT